MVKIPISKLRIKKLKINPQEEEILFEIEIKKEYSLTEEEFDELSYRELANEPLDEEMVGESIFLGYYENWMFFCIKGQVLSILDGKLVPLLNKLKIKLLLEILHNYLTGNTS